MRYKTAMEISDLWDVNIRTVQKWAKEGRIEGVYKIGRNWMIPENAICPNKKDFFIEENMKKKRPDQPMNLTLMPLISGEFDPGHAQEYIDSIENTEERFMAQAEWHYFRGECVRASILSEKLMESRQYAIHTSALLIHIFANISMQRISVVRRDFMLMQQEIKKTGDYKKEHAIYKFAIALKETLLHNTECDFPQLLEGIRDLPEGIRLYFSYLAAHQYYLREEYRRSLGMAEMAISMAGNTYSISRIYLYLAAAMNLMGLKRTKEAEKCFMKAWEIAKPDGFLEPFGEHHGLLYGLVEKCLQKEEPEAYKKIVQIVGEFSEGWRQIHNPDMQDSVTSDLSTTEFSIAMLASKGWTNKEISVQMKMSLNQVKDIMGIIYQKLDIKGRGELKKYMLK